MKIIRFINSRLATDWNLAPKTLTAIQKAPLPPIAIPIPIPFASSLGNPRRLSTFLEPCHTILLFNIFIMIWGRQASRTQSRETTCAKLVWQSFRISVKSFACAGGFLWESSELMSNYFEVFGQIIFPRFYYIFFFANNLICGHDFYWAGRKLPRQQLFSVEVNVIFLHILKSMHL